MSLLYWPNTKIRCKRKGGGGGFGAKELNRVWVGKFAFSPSNRVVIISVNVFSAEALQILLIDALQTVS